MSWLQQNWDTLSALALAVVMLFVPAPRLRKKK